MPTGPEDLAVTVAQNDADFATLICQCLREGWSYAQGPPAEDDLQDWARRGRATRLFVKEETTALGYERRCLHLVRGQTEACALAYDQRHYEVGGWTAWLEVEVGSDQPYPARRDLHVKI